MTNKSSNDHFPELTWTFPEFQKHSRSRRWWTIFTIVDLIAFVYAIFSANFLFALILIMITGIVIFREYHQPEQITLSITQDGIFLDDRLYVWKEIESFWFIYEPPEVKNLYLSFKSYFRPTLTVPLMEQNPIAIRKLLADFLEEDIKKEGLPTSEALGRLLKL